MGVPAEGTSGHPPIELVVADRSDKEDADVGLDLIAIGKQHFRWCRIA